MIDQADQIERWTNVARVLEALPAHERLKHWNMGIWGEQNECGTVACAAGHCGLDEWFRARNFTLDFDDEGAAEISDVNPFFGAEGSDRIFLNTTRRPVETVIDEVRGFVAELRRMAELAERAPCRIGEMWPGQGGIYAGARLGRDGAPDYHLIVGPEHDGEIRWIDANTWAAALNVEGHRDFSLPFRVEQQALYDRVAKIFQRDWYWSCEQHASGSSYAWAQTFDYGGQDGWTKDYQLRARAVRRLVIQ